MLSLLFFKIFICVWVYIFFLILFHSPGLSVFISLSLLYPSYAFLPLSPCFLAHSLYVCFLTCASSFSPQMSSLSTVSVSPFFPNYTSSVSPTPFSHVHTQAHALSLFLSPSILPLNWSIFSQRFQKI